MIRTRFTGGRQTPHVNKRYRGSLLLNGNLGNLGNDAALALQIFRADIDKLANEAIKPAEESLANAAADLLDIIQNGTATPRQVQVYNEWAKRMWQRGINLVKLVREVGIEMDPAPMPPIFAYEYSGSGMGLNITLRTTAAGTVDPDKTLVVFGPQNALQILPVNDAQLSGLSAGLGVFAGVPGPWSLAELIVIAVAAAVLAVLVVWAIYEFRRDHAAEQYKGYTQEVRKAQEAYYACVNTCTAQAVAQAQAAGQRPDFGAIAKACGGVTGSQCGVPPKIEGKPPAPGEGSFLSQLRGVIIAGGLVTLGYFGLKYLSSRDSGGGGGGGE